MIPSEEWSFDAITRIDHTRGTRLQNVGQFRGILEQLTIALKSALSTGALRCGMDFFRDCPRSIIQFRIEPELYDAFFNARTGYRAQFWIAPERGSAANSECMGLLRSALVNLPDRFTARKIVCRTGGPHREDDDLGEYEVTRDLFIKSFESPSSKIWICERLITGKIGLLQSLYDEVRESAHRLDVRRWPNGRAPYPEAEFALLDLKGAFVGGDQPKSSEIRAHDIHKTGWS